MVRRTPIQIVVIRDKSDDQTNAYVSAIELAFEGRSRQAKGAPRYLCDAIDLQMHVLEPDLAHPTFDAAKLLEAAAHTIVVELRSGLNATRSAEQQAFFARLAAEQLVDEAQQLTVTLPEPRVGGRLQLATTGADEVENSLLPAATALHALELARRTLAAALPAPSPEVGGSRLNFFISHSKLDGIPATLSLTGLMRRLRDLGAAASSSGMTTRFPYFYDVESIAPGADWRKALEAKARSSVLIALRTDEYQNRYWCRMEYQWAEQTGVPIVVADLRTGQFQAADRLPFGTAVALRLSDGNLLRLILHACASHVRFLRDRYMAAHSQQGDWEVLPRHPTALSLAGALGRLNTGRKPGPGARIYYPPPRLPAAYIEAIKPMLARMQIPVKLRSMDQLD